MDSKKRLNTVFLNAPLCGLLIACVPFSGQISRIAGETRTTGCVKISNSADKCITSEKLRYADDHQITYQAYRINYTNLEHGLPNNSYSLSFEFPGLSEESFHKLMQRYGGQGYVKWQQNRAQPYELVDFLPPKIQALLHRTLNQDYKPFPPDELPPEDFWVRKAGPRQEFETGMSCLDAAYEVIRDLGYEPKSQSAMTGHVGAPIVEATLKSPKFYTSREVLSRESFLPDSPSAARSRGRQLGDLFLIDTQANHSLGAAHAMVWIDDDLFFEKPDMGTSDPFRMVSWAVGAGAWLNNPGNLDAENYQPEQEHVTVYRYKQLPKIWAFTGKHYYYDYISDQHREQHVTLPDIIAKKYIFNLDVGIGGGLSTMRINPVTEVTLVTDNQGRAAYANASALGFKKHY